MGGTLTFAVSISRFLAGCLEHLEPRAGRGGSQFLADSLEHLGPRAGGPFPARGLKCSKGSAQNGFPPLSRPELLNVPNSRPKMDRPPGPRS